MRKLLITLTLILISSTTLCAAGEPQGDATMQRAIGFMEWLFEVEFTAQQRERYRKILEATLDGADDGAIEAVTAMARIHEKLPELSEADRSALRAQTKSEFVRLLQASDDVDSQWLLSVVMPVGGARTQASAASTADAQSTAVAAATQPVATALLGRWSDARISMIQYQDRHTGAPAPTNGRTFTYQFNADGTYSFTGLMQSVMYQCTTTMYSNETGRYFVQGDAVSLKPENNPLRTTNNCAPSSKREGPGKLVERSYQFRVINGERATLEFVGGDGAVMRFARSE